MSPAQACDRIGSPPLGRMFMHDDNDPDPHPLDDPDFDFDDPAVQKRIGELRRRWPTMRHFVAEMVERRTGEPRERVLREMEEQDAPVDLTFYFDGGEPPMTFRFGGDGTPKAIH